jgi:hypothetical protein
LSRRLAFAFTLGAAIGAGGAVFAQSGSIGGTVGKQGKSISGGDETSEKSTRLQPQMQRAAHEAAMPHASISGRWHWDIKCPTANFTGLLNIVQTGNTFSGEFGHTNFWDNGTVSNGQVRGNLVTFDREYLGMDHVRLSLTNGGSVMQGPHDNAVWGHCLIFAKKNN